MSLIIIPYPCNPDEVNKYTNIESVRLSSTYMHGELQHINGFDIFGFDKQAFLKEHQTDNSGHYVRDFQPGIYPCTFESEPCTLFYWEAGGMRDHLKGLVVLDTDADAFEYAKTVMKTNNFLFKIILWK